MCKLRGSLLLWGTALTASPLPHPGPACLTAPLQDPSNKQYVLADDNLKALTGESRIRAFGIQSLIKHHFLKD